jgi:competence protein ComGC
MLSRFYIILALCIIASLSASCRESASSYNESTLKAHEVMLKDDLYQIRKTIDLYSADQGKLPESLDDLVRAGYLHHIPEDPFTNKPDWKLIIGADPNSKGNRGIIDIRSSSTAKSSEGKPYNEW